MKYFTILIAIALIGCSSEAEEEQTADDLMKEILEEQEEFVTDFVEKDPPAEGSQKELILGTWYDATSDLEMNISKDRYISYIDGRKGWDNDWELSSGSTLTDDNIDDNGTYLHVILEDTGEPFYSLEILEVDENNFHGLSVGSSGDGPNDHKYWSRIRPTYEETEEL